ncbi:hypothetical protein CcI156_01150 [Frankia sp. CcI156]|uniref:Uncharacterized protein n=1 Tax=Frankia casuarinae (strain DSM 45818 / CECT 9043 / HFP020203 / CcI3) TaxID=106370 RepID=Q2JFW6_FRACC|nr:MULTISPECIES: hypothetical protein [Frankia]ABD09826.1 hypothetical protein Francci3_0440 [Frankia casuarinae]ETA04466.1 hypothetical protein CcI6DRAFT_00240 [Frankia sp. CcI6]EYT92282.1 hypothetical protein ThrDRAFT_02064 [Frankia casuarinae]KFB06487.1 Frankia-40 domain [Frankia sp. Allo2]OHV50867.1 hypothetical protein CgIS1_04295 [Frankia sp. CgIS1]
MDIDPPRTPPRTPDDTPPDVITFIGRIDGTVITVGTQPSVPRRTPVVVLRTQSALLDVLCVAHLVPDEAHRLAALLSSAALSSVGRSASRPSGAAPPPADLACGVRSRHIISAEEGSSAAELRHALALLPAGARLVDFVSDTDVALIFSVDDPPWPTINLGGGPSG